MVVVADIPAVSQGHGGGSVLFHEISTLERMGKLDAIIQSGKENSWKDVPIFDNSPEQWNLTRNQYLIDYFSFIRLKHYYRHVKIPSCLFTNGGGFALTAEFIHDLQRTLKIPIIVDCPAHDIKTTIEEHIRLLGSYPYINLTNPFLFELSTKHQQLADMIIVPSEIAKQNLLEPDNLGQKIDHDKVKAVHHGVDIDNSTKVERTDYRFTVLYVSVYSPDKGTIYLLEAWKKLNFPKENAVLKYTNNLYSTFAQDLRQTYGGDIRVYHNLPLLELSALYDTSDVLVNSSVTEAFGLTSLEAMAIPFQ